MVHRIKSIELCSFVLFLVLVFHNHPCCAEETSLGGTQLLSDEEVHTSVKRAHNLNLQGKQPERKKILEELLENERKRSVNSWDLVPYLLPLSDALGKLGSFKEKQARLLEAYKIISPRGSLDDFKDLNASDVLVGMVDVCIELKLEKCGNHTKKEMIERALKIKENIFGKNSYELIPTILRLADLSDKNQFKYQNLERARTILHNHILRSSNTIYGNKFDEEQKAWLADINIKLASVSKELGYSNHQFDNADNARKLIVELRQDKTMKIVPALLLLGDVQHHQNNIRKREGYLQTALNIQQSKENLGPESLELVTTLVPLAKLKHERNDFDGALKDAKSALKLQEKPLGEVHSDLIPTLNVIATILRSKSELASEEQRKKLLEEEEGVLNWVRQIQMSQREVKNNIHSQEEEQQEELREKHDRVEDQGEEEKARQPLSNVFTYNFLKALLVILASVGVFKRDEILRVFGIAQSGGVVKVTEYKQDVCMIIV